MPCVGTAQRDILYIDILSELEALIAAHPNCQCLIGGDFNTSLDSTANVSVATNNFIRDNQLLRCDALFPVADKFTFSTNQRIVAVLLTIC
jgi:hypothetical protein